MRKWFKHVQNQKGLTLIELLAVVVILGIIAAIAVPAIGGIIDNTKKDAHVSNALLIINSAKLAVVSNDSDVLKEINKSDNKILVSELADNGFLAAIPSDPDSNTAVYGSKSYVKVVGNVYSVYLDGSKNNVGSSGTPATEQELNANGKDQIE